MAHKTHKLTVKEFNNEIDQILNKICKLCLQAQMAGFNRNFDLSVKHNGEKVSLGTWDFKVKMTVDPDGKEVTPDMVTKSDNKDPANTAF